MYVAEYRYHCCSAVYPQGGIRDGRLVRRSPNVGNVQGSRRVLPAWCKSADQTRDHADRCQLKVPDDITILFTDDNYGNLVTVQDPEKFHPAGAGMYYHVDCKRLLILS
jgi:hypothetical protein